MNSVAPQCSIWAAQPSTASANNSFESNSTNVHKEICIENILVKNGVAEGNQTTIKEVSVKQSSTARKCLRYFSLKSALCRGLIVGILLADIALATVIALWLTTPKTTTTTTTTVATTTEPQINAMSMMILMNTTSSTVTTQTSTTSVTTTSTSTSTRTSSTTSTSTTTTSTTSTTSTTTSTTSTKTTSTTSTTTMAMVSNACWGNTGDTYQLLYLDISTALPWTLYNFTYIASSTTTAKLYFVFQSDPDYWYLDDVFVTNSSGTQLLANPGFETGSSSSWSYCNPSAATFAGTVDSNKPKNGFYAYEDGSIGHFDYLSQSFSVTAGSTYKIRFWLNTPAVNGTYAIITINA